MTDASDETPMEKFENLGRRLFRVTKDDIAKVEREAKELLDDAIVSRAVVYE